MSHGKKSKRKQHKEHPELKYAEADTHLNKRPPHVDITGQVETNFPPDLVKRYDTAGEKEERWNRKRFIAEIVAAILLAASVGIIAWQGFLLRESNRINRESLKSVQRAFVNFQKIEPNPSRPALHKPIEFYNFVAYWENGGNTTARSTISYFGVREVNSSTPDFQFKEKDIPIPYAPIGPKATRSIGPIYERADISSLMEQGKTLMFWGWIGYRDVFNKIHVTEFCVLVAGINVDLTGEKPAGMAFSGCPVHNCDDDDCEDYAKIAARVKSAP